MTKILKYLAIAGAVFMLVANLQFSLFNYGLTSNQLSQPILAQTGTAGSTSSGGSSTPMNDPVPTACPSATIVTVSDQKNNVKSCNCTVKRKIYVGGSTGDSTGTEIKIEYEFYTFRGMENTCKSGSQTDKCDAFSCSSTQTGGGSSGGGTTGGGSSGGGTTGGGTTGGGTTGGGTTGGGTTGPTGSTGGGN